MGFSIWQLAIVLVIVLLLFGAKRLRNVGSDLGESVKGFKDAMKKPNDEVDDSAAQKTIEDPSDSQNTVINENATEQDKEKS